MHAISNDVEWPLLLTQISSHTHAIILPWILQKGYEIEIEIELTDIDSEIK